MKLTIGYFYPEELNLYGDTGNIEILLSRAKSRGFDTELIKITPFTTVGSELMSKINLVFMGGGPDAGQKEMYQDLVSNKGPFIKDYIESGGVALFICGSYQLLGKYYKSADGSELKGLDIFDLHTVHYGLDKKRCVGNTVCTLNQSILDNPQFKAINKTGKYIVGFENHGGRTYLNKNSSLKPFANVISGFGNNAEDKTEGAHYKNSIGTYFHGPILSKNPHLADFLIIKALGLEKLEDLDDTVINKAHSALVQRFK